MPEIPGQRWSQSDDELVQSFEAPQAAEAVRRDAQSRFAKSSQIASAASPESNEGCAPSSVDNQCSEGAGHIPATIAFGQLTPPSGGGSCFASRARGARVRCATSRSIVVAPDQSKCDYSGINRVAAGVQPREHLARQSEATYHLRDLRTYPCPLVWRRSVTQIELPPFWRRGVCTLPRPPSTTSRQARRDATRPQRLVFA
jgi:hypothetical protein